MSIGGATDRVDAPREEASVAGSSEGARRPAGPAASEGAYSRTVRTAVWRLTPARGVIVITNLPEPGMVMNATFRPLWNFAVRLATTRPVRVPRWALIVTFHLRESVKTTRTRWDRLTAGLTWTLAGVGGRPTAPGAPEPAVTKSCSGPVVVPRAVAGFART